MAKGDKAYIGDGAFVSFDGFCLRLTTEDGINETNVIVLEPEVWHNLERYVKELKEEVEDG